MKGPVKRGRLSHVQLPNRLLWKWQIDPRRTLLRGTYSVVDVDISMNECAPDSRTLLQWFGCFVLLSSPRGILFIYRKILKIRRNLQKVIWSFIRCHSKTISFNIKWLYRKKRKKKLRIKVLPIGLEWNKCGRVTIGAYFPKVKITLFLNCICLSGSRWWNLCAELDTTESKN